MKVVIEVACDTDAFEDAPMEEIARILRVAADKAAEAPFQSGAGGSLRDFNGNRVGQWIIE